MPRLREGEESEGRQAMRKGETCGNCLFRFVDPVQWVNGDTGRKEDQHLCCRYPPAPVRNSHSGVPIVTLDFWCGEWQPENPKKTP
jgi:hypothetical protein